MWLRIPPVTVGQTIDNMSKDFFRTVRGDLPSAEMGLTYAHEHIVIDDCYVTGKHPEFLLNDADKIAEELLNFYNVGGRTVIDTMPANAGRNVKKSVEVSQRSGVQIVVPTGIHLEQYYPENHWRYSYSEDELTQLFIADIEEGHISSASCILANLAMDLGRPLVYDPKTRTVIDDAEATQLLTRKYRAPWQHPHPDNV